MRFSTTQARDRLSEIITRVQDPREYCVLTRHGRPVAAIVSMAELKRIWADENIEEIGAGRHVPSMFLFGKGTEYKTTSEAAAAIHQIQLDRRTEREVLARAGKTPLPGGELTMEVEVAVPEAPPRRRRWWRFRRAKEAAPEAKRREISDEVRAELSDLVAHNFYRRDG